MKKIIVFSVLALLGFNTFSQTIWVPQNSGTNSSLTDIQFINDSVGWACGPGIILHTNDGGENWITQDSDVGASSIFLLIQI